MFTFTSLPPRLKIKVRLAEDLERLADTTPSIDRRYDFLAQADALRAEVDAAITEATR
jgi:hypothetical protein